MSTGDVGDSEQWLASAAAPQSRALCFSCGYELEGLRRGDACPECGTPVRRSLAPLRHPENQAWVRSIALGLNCSRIGGVLGSLLVLGSVVMFLGLAISGAILYAIDSTALSSWDGRIFLALLFASLAMPVLGVLTTCTLYTFGCWRLGARNELGLSPVGEHALRARWTGISVGAAMAASAASPMSIVSPLGGMSQFTTSASFVFAALAFGAMVLAAWHFSCLRHVMRWVEIHAHPRRATLVRAVRPPGAAGFFVTLCVLLGPTLLFGGWAGLVCLAIVLLLHSIRLHKAYKALRRTIALGADDSQPASVAEQVQESAQAAG